VSIVFRDANVCRESSDVLSQVFMEKCETFGKE
jgi:hypothetical protein